MVKNAEQISDLLASCRTIAIVGLSAKPERPSYEVAEYLQAHGYRIIPINPTYAGIDILDEHCYPTLKQAAAVLSEEGVAIDIVDCFRRQDHMLTVVEDAIEARARCIWMQLGITNEAAAACAQKAGLDVVMDRCMKTEHARLSR